MTTALVKTALRIKPPQVNEETKELQIVRNENKVCLGEKSFHFDFLYPSYATEQDVYESSIAPLLNRFVEGNNVTLLTYGQADMYPRLDDQGILHQFAYSFFDKLKDAEYQIYASCLELYDEDMIDLLALKSNEQHPVIRKDIQGKLYWQGIREKRAYTAEELLR
ncbi:hypothetical protein G6F56_012626 [Rhizopus delemar]|nr:hypothetical protein G6F56_012626 [Rhizopus delemar]